MLRASIRSLRYRCVPHLAAGSDLLRRPFVADDGDLLVIGVGASGELGLGKTALRAELPTPVSAIKEKVLSVCCGASCTFAITGKNAVDESHSWTEMAWQSLATCTPRA